MEGEKGGGLDELTYKLVSDNRSAVHSRLATVQGRNSTAAELGNMRARDRMITNTVRSRPRII